jgi:hypothetical protein
MNSYLWVTLNHTVSQHYPGVSYENIAVILICPRAPLNKAHRCLVLTQANFGISYPICPAKN